MYKETVIIKGELGKWGHFNEEGIEGKLDRERKRRERDKYCLAS